MTRYHLSMAARNVYREYYQKNKDFFYEWMRPVDENIPEVDNELRQEDQASTSQWDHASKAIALLLQHPHFYRCDKEFLRKLATITTFKNIFLIAHGLVHLNFHIACDNKEKIAKIAAYLLGVFSRPLEQIKQDLFEDPFKTICEENIFISF